MSRIFSSANRSRALVCLFLFVAFAGVSFSQSLNELRLRPSEATGGTNLYSRNFGWSSSLVGLAGRSGLDAGLGISYNSLVWIKAAATSEIIYNPDAGKVGPGFKFGYSTIEYPYYDSTNSRYAFMMVGADGSRTEFRQVGSTDYFEPGDSSYRSLKINTGAQLDGKAADIDITVRGTDGTQMHYIWKSGFYRLHEIKDRNGNYVEMEYSSTGGRLTKVIDTLGREINVAYDTGGYPTTITQTWKDGNGGGTNNVTHTWASFTYTNVTVSTNFSGLTVTGPANSTTVKTLEKITYADGSATKFEYNGYVQVKKITNVAADTTTNLNYVETDLANVSGTQTDVPRMGETRSWVKDFNGNAAVVVKNTLTASQSYSLGSASGTATRIQIYVQGHPEDLRSNTFLYASGWNEGLPIGSEDCITTSASCTTQKRWTWNQWTQDNTGVSYILNPRITESKVGDGTNTKRTTISYGSNGYGLPETVEVFNGTASTPMKKSVTTYNLSSTYTNRRIIGLPSMTEAWGWNDLTSTLEYVGRATYTYDEGDFSGSGQTISPTKHDGTNYGSSFVAGRGNMTSVRRWDMTYPTTESASTVSTTKYNTAGAVVSKTSPWYSTYTRTVSISYADNYNDTTTPRGTYAYPTTVTDPNSQSSTVKYRYDIGANVEANSPAPAGQTYGKTSKRLYDAYGRLEKDSVYVNTAEQFYTRYEYPTTGTQSKVYSTITDVTGSTTGPDTADEVLSESFTDGAGRVIKSRSPHTFNTNGTTATWSGVKAEYDLLGRVKKQSVPTEVDSNFEPAGDDYTRGYLWTYQKYDWKGRVVRKINTDGTDSPTLNDSDIIISYEGCGCAGGQVTTIEGERVPYGTSSFARRKQKIHEDILGRPFKTETFEWDGSTVYSTNTATYNGRDQVVLARQYSGTTSSGVFQDTTASFDGFGRQSQSHKPEQRDNSNNLKYTTYTYNLDDSISTVTDGRTVVASYTYNSRGLVTNIGWNVGSTGITDTTDVTFAYDNLGNRTQMTDGLGQVDYEYDSLSRMTAETRDFTDTLDEAPISGGKFKLEYTYNLIGLKSYKDPYGKTIEYVNDKIGRVSTITGTSFGGVTNYLSNPQFRAWGALKYVQYGADTQSATSYDNRLRPATHLLNKISDPNTYKTFDKSYEYYSDGKLKLSDESVTYLDKFDRLFKYDHQGRVSEAKSGTEAHGTTETELYKLPYRQSYTHDAFGNLTGRDSTLWDYTSGDWDFEYTMVNNRELYSAGYDNDGRQTYASEDDIYFDFDAAGRLERTERGLAYETLFGRDGAGRELKRSQRTYDLEDEEWNEWKTSYFINSSVLGQAISETTETGRKKNTFVVAGGTIVARQTESDTNTELVSWQFNDPAGTSSRGFDNRESDALGNNVGIAPVLSPRRPSNSDSPSSSNVHESFDSGECSLDGIYVPCSMAQRALSSGAAFEGVAVTGYHKVINQKTGAVTTSGAFLVNAGYGIGIMPLSMMGNMGMLSGSFAVNAAAGSAAGWSNVINATLNPSAPSNSQVANALGWSNQNNASGGDSSYQIGAVYAGVNDSSVTVGASTLALPTAFEREDIPEVVRDFYRNRAGQIARCVNFVFGQLSDGTKVNTAQRDIPTQTLKNAPFFDNSLTQGQLQNYTGKDHTQGTFGYVEGEGGTVYIASELYFGDSSRKPISSNEVVRTFFHELGNILSHQHKGNAKYFGDPNGIGNAKDPDTGARFEKCLFGSVPF